MIDYAGATDSPSLVLVRVFETKKFEVCNLFINHTLLNCTQENSSFKTFFFKDSFIASWHKSTNSKRIFVNQRNFKRSWSFTDSILLKMYI